MMRAGRKQNYLDQIPVRSSLCPWKEEAGKAVLAVEHKGILYAFTQRVFHKPRVSYITLDVYGTAVWKQIDGEKTVGEISDGLEQQFPEAQGICCPGWWCSSPSCRQMVLCTCAE